MAAIQSNSTEQNARRSASRSLIPAPTEWQSIATILVAILFAIFAGVSSWLVDYRGQVLQLLLACGSLTATLLILERIRTEQIRVLATEPQLSSKIPDLLAQESGIRTVTLSPLLGAGPAKTYLELLEADTRALAQALGGPRP